MSRLLTEYIDNSQQNETNSQQVTPEKEIKSHSKVHQKRQDPIIRLQDIKRQISICPVS